MAITWSQVRDVVDAVLELPQPDRSQYLDEACPQPALRRYVDSLVLAYDQAGNFLESPAPVQSLSSLGVPHESWVGRRLGPYEISGEIGHGGMGSVYLASRADDQYQKRVAIKLIRSGFESAFALSRFRTERQILATLEHPNIARLLDGGTSENGSPYFVMEFVEGEPIDRYCDARRLPIRERLLLFRSVCAAVEHAHRNLIIHRDLKPANILITKEHTPKLLDFGIAKLLGQEPAVREAEPSVALLRILTPEYASPEQITGAPITTATDVYSLGVVLYLLLTGRRPYDVDARRPESLAAAICCTEPPKPSLAVRQSTAAESADRATGLTPKEIAADRACKPEKLGRQLAGDLDNIVLKALRKEPERRYGSVERFSEDIRRHLDGLPVTARAETWRYRAQKFVTRNGPAVGAFALLVLSLCAGLLGTMHEARIARAQQAVANRRFQEVRELANSLMFEVHDGIASLPGATPVRKRLVERALKYLDSLAADAQGDHSLEMELATAYDKIGDVQGQPMEANLGDPKAAAASYEKALSLRERLAAEKPQDVQRSRELVYSYIRLSDLLGYGGDVSRALTYARKEIPTAHKVAQQDPSSWENRLLLAMCHVDQGSKEAENGERAVGLEQLRRGVAMLEQLRAEHPTELPLQRKLAIAYGRLGDLRRTDSSGLVEAMAWYRSAIATLRPLLSRQPENAEIRRVLAFYEGVIGELLDELGQRPAALAQEQRTLGSLQSLAAADPANAQLQQDIGGVRAMIGIILMQSGDTRPAVAELEQSVAILATAHDAANSQSYAGTRLLLAQLWLGKAELTLAEAAAPTRQEHCRQARVWLQQSLPALQALPNKGASLAALVPLTDIQRDLSRCDEPLASTEHSRRARPR
jgi:non-specific serine/threonine protein kinase/serine/threonine-protein kinase